MGLVCTHECQRKSELWVVSKFRKLGLFKTSLILFFLLRKGNYELKKRKAAEFQGTNEAGK